LGDTVIELGAGLGNLTGRLMGRKLRYVAGEQDGLYLHALHNRFLRTPSVKVCELHPEVPSGFTAWVNQFDSALCVNVLENVDDPKQVLSSVATCIKAGGNLVVLAPQGPSLFGSVDKGLGQKRRFAEAGLRKMLEDLGLKIESVRQINKIGAPAWWFASRVLQREKISRPALKLWDKTVWFQRLIDPLLPWRGLSLVIVARKQQG
jgi:SAM-dependent methyltransferase